jgi:hypothetical protein
MKLPYLNSFTLLQGISALERIMRFKRTQPAVVEKTDFGFVKRVFAGVRKSFEDFYPEL